MAYQQHYTFSFSARADYEGAGVYAEFIGPEDHRPRSPGAQGSLGTDRHPRRRARTPKARCSKCPAASVRIGENIPAGKHVWIDDLDLRYGDPAPYQPCAEREIALTTDKPHNRVDEHDPFTVKIRATVWGTASDVPAGGLPVHLVLMDEMDKVIQEWDTAMQDRAAGGQQEDSPQLHQPGRRGDACPRGCRRATGGS